MSDAFAEFPLGEEGTRPDKNDSHPRSTTAAAQAIPIPHPQSLLEFDSEDTVRDRILTIAPASYVSAAPPYQRAGGGGTRRSSSVIRRVHYCQRVIAIVEQLTATVFRWCHAFVNGLLYLVHLCVIAAPLACVRVAFGFLRSSVAFLGRVVQLGWTCVVLAPVGYVRVAVRTLRRVHASVVRTLSIWYERFVRAVVGRVRSLAAALFQFFALTNLLVKWWFARTALVLVRCGHLAIHHVRGVTASTRRIANAAYTRGWPRLLVRAHAVAGVVSRSRTSMSHVLHAVCTGTLTAFRASISMLSKGTPTRLEAVRLMTRMWQSVRARFRRSYYDVAVTAHAADRSLPRVARDTGGRWTLFRGNLRRSAAAPFLLGMAVGAVLVAGVRVEQNRSTPTVVSTDATAAKTAISGSTPQSPQRNTAVIHGADANVITAAVDVPAGDRGSAMVATAGSVPEDRAAPVRGYRGSLAVTSRPQGAGVFLNGRRVGTTPLAISNLPVGSRAVRLTLDGYETWSRAVQVVANQRTSITADLRSSESAKAEAPVDD